MSYRFCIISNPVFIREKFNSLLGGQCTSAKSITANVLGSNACIKTRIVVGVESGLEQELEALQEVKAEGVNLIWTVISKITSISHNPQLPALGN